MSDAAKYRLAAAGAVTAIAVLAMGASAAPALPTGAPLAVEATPLVPLDTEAALTIVGIRGQISIDTRDERELRIVSREPGENGAERPVGIWDDGRTMIVGPAPGDKGGARYLHVEIPRNLAISVDAVDSDLAILIAGGSIGLRGKNTRATIQGNSGSLSAELDGGSLTLLDSSEAKLTLKHVTTTIAGMTGNVNVRATGGSISLAKIDGATDVESVDSTLTTEALTGSLHIRAKGGEASAVGNKGPTEFELSGTPLHVIDAGGDVTVTSDANVDFKNLNAALRADMSGGTLRGKGGKGSLDVRGQGTEVSVEAIENGVHLQGDGLKAKVVDVSGDLYVEATNSDVVADRVGNVVVKLDRGNATVQRAAGPVQVTVVGGDVHLIDVTASVSLDLEGGDADVSWASLSGDKDSKLVNKSGSLTVSFPVSGSCRVDAKSTSGRVDSTLPLVKVADDLASAQGSVNGGARPVVHVTANGDIRLQGSTNANGLE